MIIRIFTFVISFLLLFGSYKLFSQSSVFGNEVIAIHPKAGLMSNYYNSDYSSFQGSVDCGIFKSGNGLGWSGGLFFEKDFNGTFQIGLGAFLANRSGISTLENTYQSRDKNTGRTTFVTLENKMESTLSYLEISPEFRLVLTDKFINGPFRFLTGFRLGIPVQKEFVQSENVIAPQNATFINAGGIRTTTRPIASGTIENAAMQFGISTGFENMLKIGNHNYFTQQIVFDYNFNNIVDDTPWNTFAVRLELGLRFSIQKSEKQEIIPEKEPEIIIEKEAEPEIAIIEEAPKPLPVLKFNSVVGSQTKLETGNELLATLPIVNAVFFAANSVEIPAYYNRVTPANLDIYKGNPVDYHKNILPVIAKIIKENPNSRIMLEGATSGTQNEPKGLELAKARAEAVKQAFVDLGISASIISYRALQSPRFASNQQYLEGIEENQRVDILVTNAPLQEYVSVQNYAEINGIAELDIDYSNFPEKTQAMVSLNNRNLIYDSPGKYSVPFRQRINNEQTEFELNSSVNVAGDEQKQTNKIDLNSINKEIVDLSLKNFEALLRFNYNSSDLTDENQALLKQLIQKLPDGSTILIIGSADMLGTAEYNQQLAGDRARKTENFIKNLAGSRIKIQTTTNVDKFSDSTPQGRFLNRSIKIRVK